MDLTNATELVDSFDANVTEAEASAPSGSDKSLGALRDEFIASDPSLQQNSNLRQAFDATVYTLVSLPHMSSWLDTRVLPSLYCMLLINFTTCCTTRAQWPQGILKSVCQSIIMIALASSTFGAYSNCKTSLSCRRNPTCEQ